MVASAKTQAKQQSANGEPALKLKGFKAGRNLEFDVVVPPADLSVREIHDAIPKQYFKRIMWKGFAYIARDIAQSAVAIAAMYYGGYAAIDAVDTTFNNNIASAIIRLVLWNTFWFVQGLSWTGLWVMAHECGHQSFSDSKTVNDAVGWVLHSFLLVPYHSWRITHGNHHKHTNHITKDTVFVPDQKSEVLKEAISESPIVSMFFMLVMVTVGWPAYLAFNIAGQPYDRRANHFETNSPLFRPADASDVAVSDFGCGLAALGVAVSIYQFGLSNVLCWYLIPYFWVNFWLVLITYLQHSDIRLPHYNAEEWTFVRGALATVDRDFGPALNWWLHHINDSHVIHHMFSQMPFYHAIQVTRKHARGIFGDLYLFSDRSIMGSLWESWSECRYVIPTDGVAVYRK